MFDFANLEPPIIFGKFEEGVKAVLPLNENEVLIACKDLIVQNVSNIESQMLEINFDSPVFCLMKWQNCILALLKNGNLKIL